MSGRRNGQQHFLRRCAGFTLLEIIISLAVVSLILGVVVSQMGDFLEADMKKASNKMAATMRYLYNKAATEGMYIRLVLDLEERSYWVEATTDPFVISRIGTGGEKAAREGEEGAEGEGDAEDEALEEEAELKEGEIPKLKPHKATFSKVDSFLLRPTKLPGQVFFKDVLVEHLPHPVDGGQASIFFFPNGYVELAIINLRDEDDEIHYSLKTNPISGKVSIENVYRGSLDEE